MVEGPGCTLNGEKIRSRVQRGQKVKEIRGSLTKPTKSNPEGHGFHSFHGCLYTGVQTLGKELFMYFGTRALRVHFGMNGSMRINPAERNARTGSAPVLEIHLTNDIVCFFDSTVEIRLTEDCEQRVRAMESLDVCSSKFSFSQSEDAVRSQRSRMLCDVLLDQTIMPGVGNIIKNEALFDSGLHPAVKVQQLSHEQIHHLVKMTRDFTLLFYKCRKSGSPLYKHYKVYKRPQCGQCFHVITVCRLGDNGRMTYLCERCQKGDPSGVDISQLPVRNSLIDWAYNKRTSDDVAKKEEEDWACHLCTLINQPAATACDACLTPRPEVHKGDVTAEASPVTTDLIKYPCTAFKKPQEELKVNWSVRKMGATSGGSFISPGPSVPRCTSHRRPAVLRVVHKDGENKGRQFYACSLPRETKCNFFEWADTHFPSCHHGKRCLMRTVLKIGPNNGRNFYTCSFQKGKQCDFFQWAENGPGMAILPGC
ncbi:endonuclease 8-like 3 [Solea senegalensis]|uniref:Endonuclease 8-like 3 n=1 Tax=Solea senegalensis TaxID=28829 RepID=A0AAV6SNX0_SOLSE|nr:endonuclease 8-like 3 [Solea senegalensis]